MYRAYARYGVNGKVEWKWEITPLPPQKDPLVFDLKLQLVEQQLMRDIDTTLDELGESRGDWWFSRTLYKIALFNAIAQAVRS